VIYLDGMVFGEHHVISAVGVDRAGHKHVLGIQQGATENAAAVGAKYRLASKAFTKTIGRFIEGEAIETGTLRELLFPPSPEDASTATWFACASMKARRNCVSSAALPNVLSPAPRLMLITSAK